MSPLIHNILLPDVRFLCLNKDQIFSSRYAVIRDNRSRDNESRLYIKFGQYCSIVRFNSHSWKNFEFSSGSLLSLWQAHLKVLGFF